MQLIQTSIVPTKMLLFDVCAIQNNLNIDLENATSWFIQNGLKPNPADKYQATWYLAKRKTNLTLN